jgi:hypothetical protein
MATGEITLEEIDRAARYLRETQQAGKKLTPWVTTPNASKKKWLVLAEGTLRAALASPTERDGR